MGRFHMSFLFFRSLQVHLITKTIHEVLQGDFNNTYFILTKLININKFGFYCAITLWWSLFMQFFKKETHHYFRMYNQQHFFKILMSNENLNDLTSEPSKLFQLLLLVSVYENYVILNKKEHETFQEFFKISGSKERDKLKEWLNKVKTLLDVRYPVNGTNTDILMVSN